MACRFHALAFVVLTVGAIIFAFEAVHGDIKGTGLFFVAICTGAASLFLIMDKTVREHIFSGKGLCDLEGLTFDTKFEEMKLNGRVIGTISQA